ncbi:Gamma-glutamylputrescine synthetase PuuA [Pseudomonas fluorescens]|uniref:Gamma-glutamylputrescine synthetase PuuA n=1 Tax=Pseudomonas fluorescens TaxID=294 RepID=A0A5E6Q0W4_PSEFL|nr:Gamma-glutamylputrescine synthetase PuuA [Pseudomonas fluorescens]
MQFASVQQALDFLAQNPDIEMFELFIFDANGVPRGQLLHREELLAVYQSGRSLPWAMLGLPLNGDDVQESGLVREVGDIDCRAYPLEGSLVRIPSRLTPTAAVQVCMRPTEGMPAAVADPRHLLVKVIDALKADGYNPVMACELDFYLLDQPRDSQDRPQLTPEGNGVRRRSSKVDGLRELEQIEPFLEDLYAACMARNIKARAAISEYAPGQVETTSVHGDALCQMEITLEHRDALSAMDQAIRYKRIVKGVAHQHGLQACFMAKPFDHLAGTCMHMHVSLADADGNNLYASEDKAGTPLLRRSVDGMLALLIDSLLLLCPNANSYRRFQAHSYAPLTPTWSIDNRAASLRVSAGPAYTRHIEHRICGADSNPYLAAAAILASIHHGISEHVLPIVTGRKQPEADGENKQRTVGSGGLLQKKQHGSL